MREALASIAVIAALTGFVMVIAHVVEGQDHARPPYKYVVGELPQRVLSQNYRMEHCWIPGTLAVYVDGKRLLEGDDYKAFPEDGDILFDYRVRDAEIQVDYHIR